MCWSCDNPDEDWDAYLDRVRTMIADWGFMVQAVGGDRLYAPFAYTVGLTEVRSPELLVTGMGQNKAYDLLSDLAKPVLRGERLRTGQLTLGSGRVAEVLRVAVPDAHLRVAVDIYGPTISALQVVRQDQLGRWPWQAGHRAGPGGQPVLGTPQSV